jgi:hypothetical protein
MVEQARRIRIDKNPVCFGNVFLISEEKRLKGDIKRITF